MFAYSEIQDVAAAHLMGNRTTTINTTQKTKRMSNRTPTINTTQKTKEMSNLSPTNLIT
jgi:hypothetical protein